MVENLIESCSSIKHAATHHRYLSVVGGLKKNIYHNEHTVTSKKNNSSSSSSSTLVGGGAPLSFHLGGVLSFR